MYMLRKMEDIMCEWSHSYDESERSLMTSLIRCFWVPYEQSGRSFFEGNVPIVTLLGPSVAPVDEVHMKPCFMMATLIVRSRLWSGQWIRLQDLIFPDLRSFLKFPTTTNNEASTRSRWRQNALQAPYQVLHTAYYRLGWTWPFPCRRSAVYYMEHQGVSLDLFFSKQKNREFKLKYLKRVFVNNSIVCLQEVHGKDDYLQAIQVLAPRFRSFGTFFPENENAGRSAICIHWGSSI